MTVSAQTRSQGCISLCGSFLLPPPLQLLPEYPRFTEFCARPSSAIASQTGTLTHVLQRGWLLADHLLLIEADDRLLENAGLKASVDHRISLSVLVGFALASCHRNSQGPFGVVERILRAIGGVSVRSLEALKVSTVPAERDVHLRVIDGIEIGLHFAPADVRLGQPGGFVT
jgi:hypothetical protein